MRKSRFATEQIIGFIKQIGAGIVASELARQYRFSPGCVRLYSRLAAAGLALSATITTH